MEYVGVEIMTRDAIDAFIEKENKAAEFLTRYHNTRKDTDPLLHIAYAVQELIQIVKWLRIELDRVSVSKTTPIQNRTEKIIELLEDLIKFEKETFGLQSDAWSDENETS
jgi:predicted flavoprotein YhiN